MGAVYLNTTQLCGKLTQQKTEWSDIIRIFFNLTPL